MRVRANLSTLEQAVVDEINQARTVRPSPPLAAWTSAPGHLLIRLPASTFSSPSFDTISYVHVEPAGSGGAAGAGAATALQGPRPYPPQQRPSPPHSGIYHHVTRPRLSLSFLH